MAQQWYFAASIYRCRWHQAHRIRGFPILIKRGIEKGVSAVLEALEKPARSENR